VSRGGLHQVRCRWHGLLHSTWWRPTVSRGGLYHGSCYRRHATLHSTWRRPTVSRGGLYQVSPRRHWLLQGAWWRPTVSRGGLCQGSGFRRHSSLHGAWRRQTLPTDGLLQPHCCTQRVLQTLSKGRVTECHIGDTTASIAHCCTRGPDQSGLRQNLARVPGSSVERGRGIECGAAPRLEEV